MDTHVAHRSDVHVCSMFMGHIDRHELFSNPLKPDVLQYVSVCVHCVIEITILHIQFSIKLNSVYLKSAIFILN